MQRLQELNPDGNGEYVDEAVDQLIDGQPEFSKSFDVIVGTAVSERTLVWMSNLLLGHEHPLLVCSSVGFYGVVRLDHPFEVLRKHIAETAITPKVPSVVVMYKFLEEWVIAHKGRYSANY